MKTKISILLLMAGFAVLISGCKKELASLEPEISERQEENAGEGAGDAAASATQITIEWPGRVENIEAAEITDDEGIVYAAIIENGKSVGLINIPSTVASVNVMAGGRKIMIDDILLEGYDAGTGIIKISDTYRIREYAHFARIAILDLDIEIMNDIESDGNALTPIGTEDNPFTGTLDGGGYELRNILIEPGGFAGLVAFNHGTIKNVDIASGTVGETGTGRAIGAVCAVNYGTVENCSNSAAVGGHSFTGGVVGYNMPNSMVTGCVNRGDVTIRTEIVGGVVGYSYGHVENCENHGTITALNQDVSGGIVGFMDNFAGGDEDAPIGAYISSSYNFGEIIGTANCGGIVGYAFGGAVENCFNFEEGKISGTVGLGVAGIVGQGLRNLKVFGCGNYAEIYGHLNMTGGVGGSFLGIMTGCKNSANVKTRLFSVGGVCGDAYEYATACYSTGDITGMALNGGAYGGNAAIVRAVYSTGNVSTGMMQVGNFAGLNQFNGEFYDCYYANGGLPDAIGQNSNANTDQVNIYVFNYDAQHPENNAWPEEDTERGWGVVSGANTPENGYYWASLGNNGENPVYPTLWWEEEVEAFIASGYSPSKRPTAKYSAVGTRTATVREILSVEEAMARSRSMKRKAE